MEEMERFGLLQIHTTQIDQNIYHTQEYEIKFTNTKFGLH